MFQYDTTYEEVEEDSKESSRLEIIETKKKEINNLTYFLNIIEEIPFNVPIVLSYKTGEPFSPTNKFIVLLDDIDGQRNSIWVKILAVEKLMPATVKISKVVGFFTRISASLIESWKVLEKRDVPFTVNFESKSEEFKELTFSFKGKCKR